MIVPALDEDHEAIVRMLDAMDMRTSDLTPAMLRDFLLQREEGRVAGVVGLEIMGEVALLRSLAVDENGRHRGLGSALVHAAEHHVWERGVRRLFLLTTTAADFFAHRGYQAIDKSQAPAPIRGTAQFSTLCPASSVLMSKPL